MILCRSKDLGYYQFESLAADKVLHGVFTRLGGVSKEPFAALNLSASVPDDPQAVEENRRRFYAALGVDPRMAVRTIQVHGGRAAAVGPADLANVQPATDGLVTATPGLALVMAFADCVPVFLHDPIRGVVGMAHAGWRGTVAGICQATVERMEQVFGCNPADIQAAIGPSIGPCCYQVGTQVADAVSKAFGRVDGLFRTTQDGQLHFNQWAANEWALREVGVGRIEQANICTACHVDEFYSHRAEGGLTGRFGALIMLRP